MPQHEGVGGGPNSSISFRINATPASHSLHSPPSLSLTTAASNNPLSLFHPSLSNTLFLSNPFLSNTLSSRSLTISFSFSATAASNNPLSISHPSPFNTLSP